MFRFRVGDGLARARAAAIEVVTWRGHHSAADEGVVIRTCRLPSSARYASVTAGGRGAMPAPSHVGFAYTVGMEDVGCYLSVSWERPHHRDERIYAADELALGLHEPALAIARARVGRVGTTRVLVRVPPDLWQCSSVRSKAWEASGELAGAAADVA